MMANNDQKNNSAQNFFELKLKPGLVTFVSQ